MIALLGLLGGLGAAYGATFTVTNTNATGKGSLDQAIIDANAAKGHDTIAFAIPGSGPHTIAIPTSLPRILDPVLIDGLTQPGASCGARGAGHTLQIVIDGLGKRNTWGGLYLKDGSEGSTVRGLAIGGFRRGLRVQDADSVTVQCNYLGMQPDGTTPIDGSEVGILAIGYSDNAIDGLVFGTDGDGTGDDTEWNLVSGNSSLGAYLYSKPGFTQSGVVVAGNLLGTDASGTLPVGNHSAIRVYYGVEDVRVGTDSDGTSDSLEANLIAGNRRTHVQVNGHGAHGFVFAGNLVGTTLDGSARLDPDQRKHGVYVVGHHDDVRIGGPLASDANRFVALDYAVIVRGSRKERDGETDFTDTNTFYGGGVPERALVQNNVIGITATGVVEPTKRAIDLYLLSDATVRDNEIVSDGAYGSVALYIRGAEVEIADNTFTNLPHEAIQLQPYYGDNEVDLELTRPDDVLALANIHGNTFDRIQQDDRSTRAAAIEAYDLPLDPVNDDMGATVVATNTWGDLNRGVAVREMWRGFVEYVEDGVPAEPEGFVSISETTSALWRSTLQLSQRYEGDSDFFDAILLNWDHGTEIALYSSWPWRPVYQRNAAGQLDTVVHESRCGSQFSYDGDATTHPSHTAGWPDGIAYPVAHASFASPLKQTVDRYQVFEISGGACEECGNSVVGAGEACDDGNTDDGDGCSATCTVEAGYTCPIGVMPLTGVDAATGAPLSHDAPDPRWTVSVNGGPYASAVTVDHEACEPKKGLTYMDVAPYSRWAAVEIDEDCVFGQDPDSMLVYRTSMPVTPAVTGVEEMTFAYLVDDRLTEVRVDGETVNDRVQGNNHRIRTLTLSTDDLRIGSDAVELDVVNTGGSYTGLQIVSNQSSCGIDTDGDSVGDYGDPDSDDDGIADVDEGTDDTDNDGIPNYLDLDSDGDGTLDVATVRLTDADGDGRVDGPDTDGDGVRDAVDADPSDPSNQGVTTELADSDKDGLGDATEIELGTDPNDWDSDDDLISDGDEVNVYGTDPQLVDTDGDGLLDGAELYGFDATPGTDDDTDPADSDSDDDGLTDGEELLGPDGWPFTDDETDPNEVDTDGDYLGDGLELGFSTPIPGGTTVNGVPFYGTDPGASLDTDDGTTTDPNDDDTDDDGLLDGEEDADWDGAVDGDETDPELADTDGGGTIDGVEDLAGTDPLDPTDD